MSLSLPRNHMQKEILISVKPELLGIVLALLHEELNAGETGFDLGIASG